MLRAVFPSAYSQNKVNRLFELQCTVNKQLYNVSKDSELLEAIAILEKIRSAKRRQVKAMFIRSGYVESTSGEFKHVHFWCSEER